MQRQGGLGRVQDEKLAPAQPKQRHLWAEMDRRSVEWRESRIIVKKVEDLAPIPLNPLVNESENSFFSIFDLQITATKGSDFNLLPTEWFVFTYESHKPALICDFLLFFKSNL